MDGMRTDLGKALASRRVGAAELAAYLPETGWRISRQSGAFGRTAFRCARISPAITVTRSACRFARADDAAISHAAPTAMLVFGESGCSCFDLPEARVAVLPGDVWLMRADELARHTPAGVTSAMTVIKFDVARVAAALGEGRGFGAAMRLGRNVGAGACLGGILDNPLASPLDRLLAEGQALATLARWLGPPPEAAAGASGVSGEDARRLGRVVEMLVADLSAPPSLEALAAVAGMSHVRLNRCFRKAYGVTVFEWLRGYRLDRARRWLDDPEQSVTEVAFLCGFSSSSHFAAAFRERFRCSPQEYRRCGASASGGGAFAG
ncbi:AraC family transcriptional regulator [uncultured Alphaproteobacteria bacterium]|uniref:AraC family transcriptional regulator n=1 Tax=uncultured Alphaproteobacteria bacterium TaxID=91750 RepID=A0A212JBN8_9PROT|nr:AraC family transcriptional regulator [uncultured Alphaproteobacteria bacterium]